MQIQNSKAKHQKTQGFTLLEIIVAMGIIGLLSVVMTQTLFTTTRSNTKTEVLKDVKQNGDFSLDVMSRMIRSAKSVSSACSPLGSETTSLTIVNLDQGQTTFGCIVGDGVTRVASVSSSRTDYLTSGNMTAGGTSCAGSTLMFICTQKPGLSANVVIRLTLAQKGTPVEKFAKASASFETAVTLRN